MTPEDKELLAVHVKEIAKILYKNTPETSIETFEGIETAVRDQVQEHVTVRSLILSGRDELMPDWVRFQCDCGWAKT